MPSVAKLAQPSSPHSHASCPDSCKLWQADSTETEVAGQQPCSAAGMRQQVTATAVAEAQLPCAAGPARPAERQPALGWYSTHLQLDLTVHCPSIMPSSPFLTVSPA